MRYTTLFESGSTKDNMWTMYTLKSYNEEQGYMDISITYINIQEDKMIRLYLR